MHLVHSYSPSGALDKCWLLCSG